MRSSLFVAFAACLLACSRPKKDPAEAEDRSVAASRASAESGPNGAPGSRHEPARTRELSGADADATVVLDVLKNFESCTLGHRGTLLDLGDRTTRTIFRSARLAPLDLETREHEGATWAVVRERDVTLSFVAPAEEKPESGIVVEARILGGAAKSVTFFLNGKAIGTMGLTRGQARLVSMKAANTTVLRGTNDVLLRFSGAPRASKDELGEVDWVRVGAYDGEAPYAPPTRSDAVTTVRLSGVARRGIALRAPGFARCTSYLPSGSVLSGFVGVEGSGEAEAEIRVWTDTSEPRVVGSLRMANTTEPGAYRAVELPLGNVDAIGAVELVAKSASKGSRIMFAEPKIVGPRRENLTRPRPVRGMVLVVLGSTPRRAIATWGGSLVLPELEQLAASSLVFDAHRATTTYASGVLASMLTGLPAHKHGVVDGDVALQTSTTTLAELGRRAGVLTAMFTANPTTSGAFGFGRGWETFSSRTPLEEDPAVGIFELAESWLAAHKDERFFVVVHARGGHPPWDVSAEELRELGPSGYAGALDAKHAAEMLAKLRRPGAPRLTEADRQRAYALYERALLNHDAALGRLVARIRQLGRDGDTALVVTSDVGIDASSHVPFLEDDALDEDILGVPLMIRAPGLAPGRTSSPSSSLDLAPTILEALGLPPPPQSRGTSLWSALGIAHASERPAYAATATRLSVRWGGFVLVGSREREGKLCSFVSDPGCLADAHAERPLAAARLHALLFDELFDDAGSPRGAGSSPKPPGLLPGSPVSREPRAYVVDPASPALRAWGR